MSFTHATFAIAGLVAAAGPVIIHLLNRRRFRTVEWGAMAFLRQAMQRRRRSLRLRDVLLLMLRTAAVLLFGFALARPILGSTAGSVAFSVMIAAVFTTFAGAIGLTISRTMPWRCAWAAVGAIGLFGLIGTFFGGDRIWSSNGSGAASSREPVHAIFVIDNSRSMATRVLDGTLLDAAKRRTADAFGQLPRGSRISILPLCGPTRSYTLDAYLHGEDAQAALDRIEITDRAGSATRMFAIAAEAAARVPEMAARRIVFLTDLQANSWPRSGLAEAALSAGGPVQVVEIGPAAPENAPSQPPANVWIESFAIQDGLAEASQPATFLANVRMSGPEPIENVEIVLSVDGFDVASQHVDLQPGQSREVVLTSTIESSASPGTPAFVPATLSLHVTRPVANRLERDDARHLVVPVITALPVVFVDQYGDDENLDAGRIGETYRLRRLLAPRPAEGVYDPIVAVRRATIDTLSQSMIEDARLVVLAGIESPTDDAVRLLRAYVEQGGPLVIAAGGNFDPAAWTATAWLDGRGILPAPLAAAPVGIRPSQATGVATIEPFRLDGGSLERSLFAIPGESAAAVSDLWSLPFFFQAVEADVSDETIERAVAVEAERIAATGAALADGSSDQAELTPSWLVWKSSLQGRHGTDAGRDDAPSSETLAARTAPQVLARFDRTGDGGDGGDGLPYLVERKLGEGRVLLLTSGISSDWDTLTQTNAIVLLDKITRSMLQESIPRREFTTEDAIVLPIERRADVAYTVVMGNQKPRPIAVDAIGGGYGLRLDEIPRAGTLAVETRRSDETPSVMETTPLAVNGPPQESDLSRHAPAQFERLANSSAIRLVGPAEELVLSDGPARHRTTWKWLVGAMLLSLVGEMIAAARWRPIAPEGTS